jgi:hypothetical protein
MAKRIRPLGWDTWRAIKARCYNSKSKSYKYYGAKGVEMCEEWKNSFKSFQSWILSNGWKTGMAVTRNNDIGNYSPNNCKVKTASQNGIELKSPSKDRIIAKAKKVLCVETGIIYENCVIAAKSLNIKDSRKVSHSANPKNTRQTAGGYHWKYVV